MLLFQIKFQPGVAYKSVKSLKAYEKIYLFFSMSSKNEEIILPHEFIFVFIWYFSGAVLQYYLKSLVRKGGGGGGKKYEKMKRDKKGGCLQKWGGVKPAHYVK